MLHIALIAGAAYLLLAGLAYLAVFPILRAGRQADRRMDAEELPQPEATTPATVEREQTSARFRRRSRFARRARRPLAGRRPGG
jgi:hypothetical protein